MSEVGELKALVKQLQSAPKSEVNPCFTVETRSFRSNVSFDDF
jgi:hypothetical protein